MLVGVGEIVVGTLVAVRPSIQVPVFVASTELSITAESLGFYDVYINLVTTYTLCYIQDILTLCTVWEFHVAA